MEKAHPDVHEIFFEVFDRGHMEDGEGRDIDFKNTIIILTSNASQDVIINMCKDPDLLPDAEALEKAMRPHLVKMTFPDAAVEPPRGGAVLSRSARRCCGRSSG